MLPQNPNLEGFHIDVTQGFVNGFRNVLVPEHTEPLTMVVETYSPSQTTRRVAVPDYGWNPQPNRRHPATYDINHNVLIPTWWEQVPPVWEALGTTHYVQRSGTEFEISGTRAVTFAANQPAHYETIKVRNYLTPRIQFTATRSDTVWVWRTPDPTGRTGPNGQTALNDIMTLSDGNLALNGPDGWGGLSLSPDAVSATHVLQQDDGGGLSQNVMRSSADGLLVQHEDYYDSALAATSHAQVLPHAVILTRTEEGQPTGITQIAAKSAQFGGVVTVEGNANVKGTLRVFEAGDLSMGEFTHGPRPDGTTGN
jgi:hypothetical protein